MKVYKVHLEEEKAQFTGVQGFTSGRMHGTDRSTTEIGKKTREVRHSNYYSKEGLALKN